MTILEGKHPGEVLNYAIDWTEELGTDAIVSATATVTGATKDNEGLNAGVQSVVISGGTLGVLIKLIGTVTTAAGLTLRRLVVIPYAEPVSLELAKAQCRVDLDDSDEDELIGGYISAARRWVEERTGHILARRPFTESFDRFPFHDRALELWKQPIVSIDGITYFDGDEVEQNYADAITRFASVPTRIYPAASACWPTASCRGQVSIAFTAGYDEGEVPAELMQAQLLLIGHWYRNREAVNVGNITTMIPLGVESLCDQVRPPRVG